ncbi:MAG TPA: sensor histidine kinase [Marmoricola sp.]
MTPVTTTPLDDATRIGPRRWGVFFAAIWLLYLAAPMEEGWKQRDQVSGWIGMVATVVFGLIYLAVFVALRFRPEGAPFRPMENRPRAFLVLAVQVALGVTICAAIGQKGTAAAVYIAVQCVICLGAGWGWIFGVATAAVTYTASITVSGWHEDRGLLFGILVATLAIWGISQAINRNVEVLAVREENARLALADERNRFARDLHDILGHSLTVITVKAELANRLFDADPERARAEVRDLERLSRDALADVRRAVEGYRELTLPGELSRARSALSAAEIQADLPNSTDDVAGDVRELFAWTVREGITNVIRHSGAQHCRVRLSAREVEVVDDGRGSARSAEAGHGLVGLRERAAALGGTVVTSTLDPGFSLKVVVP